MRHSLIHTVNQRIRTRIVELFAWVKTTGGFRKSRCREIKCTHATGQNVVVVLNRPIMAKLMIPDPPLGAQV
jgi:hypothetical protein